MRISVWSSDVCSSDLKRVRFVGLNAYEAEGGVVLRDLFSQNDEGWLQDVALLERLVAAKLTSEAETIKAEGWRWIQIAQEFPYGHTGGLRRLMGEMQPLSDEEHAQREALRDEMRSEEHTSELQSLMRISYAVFCLKQKK